MTLKGYNEEESPLYLHQIMNLGLPESENPEENYKTLMKYDEQRKKDFKGVNHEFYKCSD